MANLDFENKNYIKIGIPCKNSIRNSVSEICVILFLKYIKRKKLTRYLKMKD